MTDTVAVAIITAATALAASLLTSVLTSWITLRNTRQQGENQLLLTREERAEQRVVALRDVCRDAYVRFFAAALTLATEFRWARQDRFLELHKDELESQYTSASEALMKFIPVHGLVVMVGPAEVSDAARAVREPWNTSCTSSGRPTSARNRRASLLKHAKSQLVQ